MTGAVDAIIAYRTNPHVDQHDFADSGASPVHCLGL